MAVASSSASPQEKYDVFLSFRGEDTRRNFTSHLYAALCEKKISTFIDDELNRGDQISPSLLNAIEQSKISLIIFSKEYASSRWCLEELEKILECMDKDGQIVMPVFHNIDPSHVRNQYGTFGDAFAKHEERFKGRQEMLQRWRAALKKAANLSGFDSNVIRPESELVQEVVKAVLMRLNGDSPLIDENLVGVDSRIKDIEGLLHIGSAGVHKIGIWGAGGIGKTTLARAVFNKISDRHFESSYFFENIREESEKNKGLTGLQGQIICKILGDEDAKIGSSSTIRRLSHMKALIVLDDVTNLKQIELLIEDFKWLGSGSRIIITTRDKQVLENCLVDGIYETPILSYGVALQLFSRYAFRQKFPPEDFRELAERLLSYANGLPLALKVLGSFLFKRTKKQWESQLVNLNISDHTEIGEVLKVSFEGLSENQKVVFLDIACFFKGYERDLIEAILNARNFNSHIYIDVLIERCLITTSVNNTIIMHDLLQEMGREVVRQESIDDPNRRSRLWDDEDISKVLTKNKGTRTIRGILLDMSKVRELRLKRKAFNKMHNLKFLEVCGCWHDNKVHGFEVQESDFSELRYLRWDWYSAKSLPPKFNPRNLVALYMRHSKLEQLWIGDQEQNLVNLKHIDLSDSKHLCRMPDLSLIPNLESLILKGCGNLCNILSSIHNLDKLVVLNLQGCKNMDMLPISPQCRSLRKVILSDCSNLKSISFSFISCAVEVLYLDGTAIEELPSLEHLSRLKRLSLDNCSELKNLPESIRGCKSLEYLSLKRCTIENPLSLLPHDSSFLNKLTMLDLSHTGMKELPSNFGQLRSLEKLCIGGNNFESLPGTIKDLSNLTYLHLEDCQRLKSLPELPHQLSTLDASNCISLEELSSVPTLGKDNLDWSDANFNNCYKLKLHAKALLNIQSDAVTWFHSKERESDMLDLQRHLHGSYVRGTIFYPGSEIPDWFDFISSESFIKLPRGCLNDNVIGFALCVVTSPVPDGYFVAPTFDLFVDKKPIFRDMALYNELSHIYVLKSDFDYVSIGFEFIILSKLLTLSSNSEGFVNFFSDGDSFPPGKLKKCGVKLLYAKGNDL